MDDDRRKELIIGVTNLPFFAGMIFVLRPDDGSVYGSIWNYGTGIGPLRIIERKSKKYLVCVFLNNMFETKIMAWFPVDKSFFSIMPGWQEKYLNSINENLLNIGTTPASVSQIVPSVTLLELFLAEEEPYVILKEQSKNGDDFLTLKGANAIYRYDFDGYPIDDNGKRIYKIGSNELTPSKFIWKLNSYADLYGRKMYKGAADLVSQLLPYTPNIPDFRALVY